MESASSPHECVSTEDEFVHVDNDSDTEVSHIPTDKTSRGKTSEDEGCPGPKKPTPCDNKICAKNPNKASLKSSSFSKVKDRKRHSSASDHGSAEDASVVKNHQHAEESPVTEASSQAEIAQPQPTHDHHKPTDSERRHSTSSGLPQSLSQALSQDHHEEEETREDPENHHPENLSVARTLSRMASPQGVVASGRHPPPHSSPMMGLSSAFYPNPAFSRHGGLSPEELGYFLPHPHPHRDFRARPPQYLPPAPPLIPGNLPHRPRDHLYFPESQRPFHAVNRFAQQLPLNCKDLPKDSHVPDKKPSSHSDGQQIHHKPSFMISDILGDREPSREPRGRRDETTSRGETNPAMNPLTYVPLGGARYGSLHVLCNEGRGLGLGGMGGDRDRSPGGSEDAPSCSQSPMEDDDDMSDIDIDDSEYYDGSIGP
ncbi:hypothetical protein ACOMHN_012475 [Nucella lapillus]